MIIKKHKNTCKNLGFVIQLLIWSSTFTGCNSIFAIASLVGVPLWITSSVIGLKICMITAGITMH